MRANAMHTQICGEYAIEDLLDHPAGMVEDLRDQLSDCAQIVPDPKRTGFYEVRSALLTYYIHVLPGSGKVLLLAVWPTV
jgi:hypothetical protein